jgi:hypothetical protein
MNCENKGKKSSFNFLWGIINALLKNEFSSDLLKFGWVKEKQENLF